MGPAKSWQWQPSKIVNSRQQVPKIHGRSDVPSHATLNGLYCL